MRPAVTAAQAGAYTTAQVDVLIDATLKPPEAFAPAGTYPTTYGGLGVQQGDTFRITGAGTMGAGRERRTCSIRSRSVA